MTTVALVACGKQKLTTPAEARLLYVSPLFRKASAHAAATYDRWFILSARHGLLDPGQIIAPYDLSLRHLSRAERRRWATNVLAEIERLDLDNPAYVLHAGQRYAEFLAEPLAAARPLLGLGIGQQLAWYHQRGY